MRRLAQPQVLKSAAIGAVLTAALSYPRLAMWDKKPTPMWYLEAVLFFGSFVLWAFVFAWHTEYTQRPVLTLNLRLPLFAMATFAGGLAAAGLYFFLDPTLRAQTPDDYPKSFDEWLAMTLFTLGLSQLLLVFAPFAWFIRLVRKPWLAATLTVLLGILVLALKSRTSPTPVPLPLFATLVGVRIVAGFLSIWLYLRGGLVLVWWLGLLVEARHLFALSNH